MALFLPSCETEAPWTTNNVELTMEVKTVSAGFVECSFSTSKEAYYLIAIDTVRPGYNPMEHQKQFMMLALDSANLVYLTWRNSLLKEGETNIAPFASHALHYGYINHFFHGLEPDSEYWIYAFVVDPDKQQSAGRLYLTTVRTTETSVVDIHFEYRVYGRWDYIYPVDSTGHIYDRFPYMATTRDSLDLADIYHQTPEEYFTEYFLNIMEYRLVDNILYGVRVAENDGKDAGCDFQEGHTYYTSIVAWDGTLANNVIYKFTWTGDDFKAYFKDEDSIDSYGEDD